MAEQKHFHNHSAEASEWMHEKITELLKEKYEIVELKVDCELFMRLGKAQIINVVTARFNEKKTGKYFALEGYESDNKTYDKEDCKTKRWLINNIKDLEYKAFLKFGSVAASTKSVNDTHPNQPLERKTEDLETSNTKTLETSFYVNTKQEMITTAFLSEVWIKMWVLGGTVENGLVKFDNVEIKDIQSSDKELTLKFKLKKWKCFTDVKILFMSSGQNLKVTIVHNDVDINDEDGVKRIWEERIFGVICKMQNCCIKK